VEEDVSHVDLQGIGLYQHFIGFGDDEFDDDEEGEDDDDDETEDDREGWVDVGAGIGPFDDAEQDGLGVSDAGDGLQEHDEMRDEIELFLGLTVDYDMANCVYERICELVHLNLNRSLNSI
jgi:hypothetical protein